ncbi:MAG TPA: DNA polymerase III subunit beta [Pseudomonadota bacterium]|nr:DNA polymerase III subunit beta [Xanthomonadales bacterium]HQW63862.1 DNA polymerase III subunit beta [Pseudomonadota bacterium]MBP6690878.1 DNA polymerase III subunit beta [Xanthomonadales bacterium]MBP7417862.1 DNA polymerase III subunit beta [Xanthomonadales bacterium]MBP8177089.1 DNA polymerase III subunit beta [Xanthomonadales bacterium]
MRFSVQREVLLKPLSQVVGVVERRQTLPVLANLLVSVSAEGVSFTGTDLEVEMVARMAADQLDPGEITIPARKLFDICRALPDGIKIDFKQNGERVTMSAGRSRYTLSTLPAAEFPQVDNIDLLERVTLPEATLKELIDRTAFAMAHQDVRYYLNGTLLDLREQALRCVATDGHRLALCETGIELNAKARRQIIIPRKGVLELQRLLDAGDGTVEIEFGRNHLRVRRSDFVFTTKLIDGRFPDYEAVIPIGADKILTVAREDLRAALQRASILSNEKYRGVKMELAPGRLHIVAHNPEQEEAVEELEVATHVDGLAVGFNVNYLLDALSALRGTEVMLCLRDGNSSCLIRDADNERSRHVIMPLRL